MKKFSTLIVRAMTFAALLYAATGWAQPTCTLTCPANMTLSNDPNQCGAVVNYPAPTTTGTCGTVTALPASGSFFPRATTTVNMTSTTGGGACSMTITVNDTQPPQITCPANISTVSPPGQTGAVVTFGTTASDNCPGVTVGQNQGLPSGSLFPAGTTTETFTATDATNNTATCSFTVNVVVNPFGIPVPLLDAVGLIGLGLALAFAAAFGLRRKARK